MNLSIGSGDIKFLLMGKETKGFSSLMQKFVSDEKVYYNSFASPIDALRTGAILEQNYLSILPDNYFVQFKVTNPEMNVITSSLDFAQINEGEITDFDELKTIGLSDYLDIIHPLKELKNDKQIEVLKKKFKDNYNQVQCQLFCSGLQECNLVFLSVETYDDEENYERIIKETDFVKFRIKRDESVIAQIKERASIFQSIKDFVKS